MAALARALKPGGVSLVTVPMGDGGAVPVRDSLGFYTRQWEYAAESWPDTKAICCYTLSGGMARGGGTWRASRSGSGFRVLGAEFAGGSGFRVRGSG